MRRRQRVTRLWAAKDALVQWRVHREHEIDATLRPLFAVRLLVRVRRHEKAANRDARADDSDGANDEWRLRGRTDEWVQK